jgi:hypothetical protein
MITKKELIKKGFSSSSLVSEQEEEKEMDKKPSGNGKFTEMMSLLLHSRTQVHTLHLQTNSYPEHMALNGYYNGIGDIIDGLVESFQGKYGILNGYKSYDIEGYKSTESTIKYLQDLCGKVEDLRDCCDDSYIQNQIDTVCELINSTLYKLRFLK